MRPTNIHNIYINQDILRAFKESGVQENIWDVDADALDTVTFKDCYADGHNQSDRVAGEWLLLNFKYMCPTTIDSDVLVDKSGDDYKWSRLEFEQEEEETVTAPLSEADKESVKTLLEPLGYAVYEREDVGLCVEVVTTSEDGVVWNTTDKIRTLDTLLSIGVGLELGEVVDTCTLRTWPYNGEPAEMLTIWTVVPLDAGEEDDEDEDSDDYEDGWQGILLTCVFVVDEERDASVLDEAGFRVLKHEDTGTVIAQVAFCGMSNEANRARAGFLLAVERGWPILTEKGWRRPVR